MKKLVVCIMLLSLATPCFAEIVDADFDKIRNTIFASYVVGAITVTDCLKLGSKDKTVNVKECISEKMKQTEKEISAMDEQIILEMISKKGSPI